MFRPICLFALISALLPAQDALRRSAIGGLITPVPQDANRYAVEAADPGGRFVAARAGVHFDGSFEFSALESGTYEFRLTAPGGSVVARTLGSVPGHGDVRFELPAAPATVAPVSLFRLNHRVPGKALKAMRQAVKAAGDGRAGEAVERLDAAIAADPDFVDALHLRGVLALQAKDYDRARACLVHAASLDTANPRLLADAAVIQYMARQPEEAARLARAALRLNPEIETARIVLQKLRPLRREPSASE